MRPDEQLGRIAPGGQRDEFLPLLLLADDSPTQVKSYCQLGDLFVLREADGTALGVALAVPAPGGAVELKAVAVPPERQGQGVGRRLLTAVVSELRSAGVCRVIVGTASCSIGPLAFYQKVGFRFCAIERDYFSPERGYPDGTSENGILLRDMVWMDRVL